MSVDEVCLINIIRGKLITPDILRHEPDINIDLPF